MSTPVWPDDRVRALLAMWADGMGPSAIGRQLGMSKNAVVDKVTRLGLEPRKRLPQRQGVKQAPAVTSGAAGLAEAKRRSLPRKVPPCPAPAVAPTTDGARAPGTTGGRVETPGVSTPRAFGAVGTVGCCWPLGEPGTKAFRFCRAASPLGSPYCTAHRAVAYVRVREVAA